MNFQTSLISLTKFYVRFKKTYPPTWNFSYFRTCDVSWSICKHIVRILLSTFMILKYVFSKSFNKFSEEKQTACSVRSFWERLRASSVWQNARFWTENFVWHYKLLAFSLNKTLQIQILFHVAFNKTLQSTRYTPPTTNYPLPANLAEHAQNKFTTIKNDIMRYITSSKGFIFTGAY